MGAGTTPAARILVVEDHQLLAQILETALDAEGLRVELADLADRDTLLASAQDDPPDVVLLDLELGGTIGDGARLIRPFTQAGARVLVVSAVTDRCRLAGAVEQGAVGLIGKWNPFDLLLGTILAVARGDEVMPAAERHRLLNELRCSRREEQATRRPYEQLTGRERQVLQALGRGLSVAGIASSWVVSEATVRSQVRGVLTKLGVSSQLEAVAHASRCGWLTSAE